MSDKQLTSLTVEVDRYLAQADDLKYGDPAALLSVAQTATQYAQTLGDFYRYGRALVHQAWAYGFLNQPEYSLACAMEVLTLARDHHLTEIEALAVGVIAFNFLKFGVLQEAAYLFEHERMLGEQLEDDALQAMALNDLSVVKMESQDFETAARLLRQAVKLMPVDTHDGMDSSFAHLNLSLACLKTGRFDEAVEHAEHVLSRVKDFPRCISDAHVWIGFCHLEQGELEAAHERLALARSCVANATPPIYNDNVEQLTAELFTREGRHQEAIQVLERMYEMALQDQALDYAIAALNQLKTAYERLNDTNGLVTVYKRLAEDIPARQKQSGDLRFTVLRMVFAQDKAALEAELNLSQRKSAMLSRLSHEFRTPLTIIQTSAGLLQSYADRMTLDQRQEYLEGITAQVKWMTVMLDDILEMLRFDENETTLLLPTMFSLSDLVQSVLKQVERYSISTDNVRISIQPEDACVETAPQALKTILVHLLTNAIKFSRKAVDLTMTVAHNQLTILVIDEGIGIPLAEQQEVFKPLVRGTNLDEVTGNGLGLTIVAKLVKQLHGKIDLKSVVGEGTSITVHLPLN
jgi:signal transduction histidine kinase